jgi:hypothetical protein
MMSNFDAKKALMEVLAPEDDGPAGSAHHADAPALPSLDQRVDLFLRAMHGPRVFSAQERAAARLRILDAMADDLVPGSSAQSIETVARVAPARTTTRAASGSTMLAGAWEVLREALLFPLTLSAGQPMRLVGAACAVLLVAGGGWTGAWFYVAHKTDTAIASLIDSEAKAGRVYNCGSRSVGGFPLHVEVDCTALRAQLAMSDQTTLTVDAKSLRSVASILSPNTIVTEINGPVSVTRSGQSASLVGNWQLAQLTVHGGPVTPRQVSLVFDNAEFDSVGQGRDKPLLAGGRIELNATPTATRNVNVAAHAVDVSIPDGGPITSRPFVANVAAVLRDFGSATPQMLSDHLRDWQSRGGRLEIASARIEQGDALATGSGQLGLGPDGQVEGALRLSTSGPYERLAQSYINDGGSGARKREQLAESFLGQPRIVTRSLGAPLTEKPVRKQATPQPPGNLQIPIRFLNGAVILGNTNLGAIPPLF